MNKIMRMFFNSAKGCYMLAVLDLIICLFAVFFNVYRATNGNIASFEQFTANLNAEEIRFLSIGIILFVFFILLGYNAQKEEKMSK